MRAVLLAHVGWVPIVEGTLAFHDRIPLLTVKVARVTFVPTEQDAMEVCEVEPSAVLGVRYTTGKA